MSHKRVRETTLSKNLSVASKCLAIVLVSKVRRKNSQDNLCSNHEWDDTVVDTTDGNVIVQSSEVQKALSPNGYNGKELLQDFKIRNKTCYWNPSLVESIKSLEYKGFVEPSTILVSGGDIHIENIRSAWGRRVLKAPAGFVIERIGDVNGIQMQEIPQTQFMPLPDALCSVIMELNVQRVVATLDVILDKLSAWYRDMTLPDHQVIVDILGALIKDRKVFHTGSGYFVVTPDTNRLPNGPSSSNNNSSYLPTNASWLPYHPMYVPVFQGQVGPPALTPGPPLPSSRSHMRSISCQVTTIEETESEGEDEREKIAKLGGGGGGGSKSSTLTRSSRPQSIRYSNKPGKDPKPGVDKDKDSNKNNGGSAGGGKGGKGNAGDDAKPVPVVKTKEKTSLLSKIFGRSKKKANSNNNNNNIAQQPPSDSALMPPPALPPPPPCQPIPIPTPTTTGKSQTTATDNSGSIAGGKSQEPQEKEYATFSAQFPPAEWAWYQQQLDKQKRTENWVTHQTTSSKASTVLPTNNRQAASSTLSRRPPQGSHDYHGRKSLMPLNNHQVDYLSMNDVNVYNPAQKKNPIPLGSLQYDGEFLKPDNLYESFRNSNNHPSAKQRHRNSHHRKSRDLEFIGEENTQPSSAHLKHHHHQHPSQHHNTQAQSHHHKKMSDYDVIDQGDITPVNGSNVYHSVSGLSPVSLLSEDSIAYAKLSERHQHVNPGPLHSTPRYSANRPSHGYGERTAFKLEGHEGRDRIYGGGPSDFTHGKRRSHRSKRRNHRAYSFYSGNGDDISIEYNGRLPNKNSSRVQSRDSGVNCMGLGKNNNNKNGGKNEQGAELYENTPVGKKQTHHNKQASKPTAGDSNHVHFDVNNLTCADSMSMDPFASTSSMAYQPEVTNPAFNSVVYGSSPCTTTGNFADNESTLGPMGSSVMYQTITTSALEPSELRAPQTSPQRGYYEDGSCNVSVINRKKDPGGEVVTIQAEITQGDSEEYIDVEGGTMPDIREVAGSSNGMLEIAADDDDDDDDCVKKTPGLCSGREGGVGVSMGGGGDDDCDSNQDIDVEGCGDEDGVGNGDNDNNDKDKGVGGDIEKDICVLDINDREGDGKPSQCVDSKKASKEVADPKEGNQITSMVPTVKHGNNIPPVDGGVADSGFSSPRNQGSAPASSSSSSSSDPRGQVSGQSLSDHSSGHPPSTEISDRNHHNSEDATTEGSDGLHTHSEDINMATSSEHHSGSTNDNGDLHSEDSSSACGVQRSQHHQSYHYNHHPQQQPQQQIIKYRQSSSHASGGSSCSSTHSYPYHLHGPNTNHSTLPPPSTNAKVITHPDVFNNNHNNNFVNASAASSSSNTVSYSDQEQRHFMVAPPPPQLHYHPSHPHRGPMVRSSSNPTNVQGWSSSSSSIGPQQSASRLQHRFEEEQLSKKYGGEFEVMGVL